MIFDAWSSIFHVLAMGTTGYIGLVFLLRISGNRTLSKLNSFDLVITIAFGSILSSILLDSKVTLAQGLTAIALLVFLQFAVTWASLRSGFINNFVKTRPTLIVRNGRLLRDAMKRVRVSEDEVRGAVRKHGFGTLDRVAAVTLETDGSLSVVSVEFSGALDAMKGVRGADDLAQEQSRQGR